MSDQKPDLRHRLGYMADAMVSAKVGPQARFFTRELVDEVVLLLREAEKTVLKLESDLQTERRLSDIIERDIERRAGLRP